MEIIISKCKLKGYRNISQDAQKPNYLLQFAQVVKPFNIESPAPEDYKISKFNLFASSVPTLQIDGTYDLVCNLVQRDKAYNLYLQELIPLY